MNKGDILELKIEKYAFEGKGIAKIEKENSQEKKFVVFVNGAYPGDVVKAKLKKIKKSYAEANVEEIVTSSPQRIKPKCKYFGTCGGCRQQDLSYEQQVIYKQQQVEETFRQAGLEDFTTEKIIPSENNFYYRNKMEFSFSDLRWLTEEEIKSDLQVERNFALGLHTPKTFDKVLDIDECFLQSETSAKILNFTREFFKQKNVSIYSTKTHTGFLRNLVIRQSAQTKDLMVNLVTSSEDENLLKEYASGLKNNFDEITTIVNNVNLKKAAIAVGDYEKVFLGSGFIYDKIGAYKFRISANSFFQTNTLQAEKLYQTALDFAELKGNEIVYDLYSGAGTISIFISGKAKEVYGFESVESSIFDANENLDINEIKNVRFFQSDLYKTFLPVADSLPKPNVIILDPPRSGMHKNTVDDVIKLSPEKIVYVSCNPTTQVRDIKLLTEGGYSQRDAFAKLIKIRSVDMFPHTFHIENVALLTKI